MIFNQTSNPFAKRNMEQSMNMGGNGQPEGQRNNMFEISMNYANLLEENQKLKAQINSSKKRGQPPPLHMDQSQNVLELLGSL